MTENADLRIRTQRAKYMANEISHDGYYLWLSDLIGLTDDLIPATPERVRASSDPENLNDISLRVWDGWDWKVRVKAREAGTSAWSLSDTVCCLKAMARRRRDAKVKP